VPPSLTVFLSLSPSLSLSLYNNSHNEQTPCPVLSISNHLTNCMNKQTTNNTTLHHAANTTIQQQREVAEHLEEADQSDGLFPDDRKLQSYGNLFFLLQTEPRHIATLCRLVSLTEIDTLLQTVMFTLYGNQYESREEHLLLTMFQVQYAHAAAAVYVYVFLLLLSCAFSAFLIFLQLNLSVARLLTGDKLSNIWICERVIQGQKSPPTFALDSFRSFDVD